LAIDGLNKSSNAAPATPPNGFPPGVLGDTARNMDSTRNSLDKFKKVSVLQPVKDCRDAIDKLTRQHALASQKFDEARETQALWNYGHVISSSIYAIASALFGLHLYRNGDNRGKSFVYSGTALLTSTIMNHHGWWKSVARFIARGNGNVENTLNVMLPIGVTLLSSYLTASSLNNVPLEHQAKIKTLEKMMSWVNMIVQIGNSYTTWVKGVAEREKISIEAQIKAVTMKIEPINIRNEAQTSIAKRINDGLKGAIKTIFKGTAAIPMEAV
jgi:hypothetical protein